MKKVFFYLVFVFLGTELFAQPYSFSWQEPNPYKSNGFNYISPAKNQREQGPCMIFSAVAAVEAMSQIYYHKPLSGGANGIDLAERELYSWCSGYGGPTGPASIEESLNYMDVNGLINES